MGVMKNVLETAVTDVVSVSDSSHEESDVSDQVCKKERSKVLECRRKHRARAAVDPETKGKMDKARKAIQAQHAYWKQRRGSARIRSAHTGITLRSQSAATEATSTLPSQAGEKVQSPLPKQPSYPPPSHLIEQYRARQRISPSNPLASAGTSPTFHRCALTAEVYRQFREANLSQVARKARWDPYQ